MKLRTIWLVLLLSCLGLDPVPAVFAATGSAWVAMPGLQVPRTNHALALLPGNRVLVAGGRDAVGRVIAATEIYDPAANGYQAGPVLLAPRERCTVTRLNNGNLLIAGGSNSSGLLRSAELYNPITTTITQLPDMTVARAGHTATLLPDGRVLLAGGGSATAELFDPSGSPSFTAVGALSADRTGHQAVAANGTVYVIAGKTAGGTYLAGIERFDPVSGNFSAAASLNRGRADFSATPLADGTILMVGGRAASGTLNSSEVFDPSVSAVTPATPLTTPRHSHQALLLPGGDVLVTGGTGPSGTLTSTERYDAATRTFVLGAAMPAPRSGHAALALDGGFFIAGGMSGTAVVGTASYFGPDALPRTRNLALGSARSNHTATTLTSGKILIVGGYNGSTSLSSAELFDPVTNRFAPAGSLSTARGYHTATLLRNGKVLIAGGYNGSYLSSAELYDPVTNSFTPAASLAISRRAHTATILAGGKVLIAGGYNGSYLDSAELYNPLTDSFGPAGSLGTGRHEHTATLLGNGTVLIAGGYNGSYLASAELYNPAANSFAETNPMNNSRSGHTATLLGNGNVLVVYGYNGIYQSAVESYDYTTGSFTVVNNLSIGRRYHEATLLGSGKVLVTGGYNGTYVTTAELYDPGTNSVSSAGSLASGRYYLTATLLNNGRVVVVGGTGQGGSLATAELYDPTANGFSPVGALAQVRQQPTATLLGDGTVLVVGGQYTNYLSSAEVYDPAANGFTPEGSLGRGRRSHTATLLLSGKVLVAGGYDNSPLYSVELYDPAAKSFSPGTGLGTARYGHTATLLASGKVLITGGYGYSGYLSSVELYDPGTNSFSPVTDLGTARYGHTATLLANGQVLITGGYGFSGYLSSAEVYDPATNSFSPVGSLGSARQDHTATLLGNGTVLIAGGYNGSFLSSAEVYDPATKSFSPTGNLAAARRYHTATLLGSGMVLIAGGYNGSYLSSADLYDPATKMFFPLTPLRTARQLHAATLLGDGTVLIAGGYNSSTGHLSSAELYELSGTFLSGRITDLSNGNPIPGVQVALSGDAGTWTTDSDGRFAAAVPQGTYSMTISKSGYETVTLSPVSISGFRRGFDIQITEPDLLNVTTASLPPAQATLPYSARVFFTGAAWPFTIKRFSGQLPPGLYLFPATGQITGIPEAPGASTFMVDLTDVDGFTAQREFTIEVSTPLALVAPVLPRATTLKPYFAVFGATGGTQPYTFSIFGPTWLSLTDNGELSGTPTPVTGTYSLTITVTDALGRTTSRNVDLSVDPPLTPSAAGLGDGIVGTPYSATRTATGGFGAYTWSLHSGRLPAGLTLTPATGEIAGTPTTATRSIFVLAVTDEAGRVAYRDCMLTIAAVLKIVTTALPDGVKNEPFSELIRVQGGIPPYSFAFTGQLPAGLNLSPATGIVSGTPTTAGLTNFNLTVADSSASARQTASRILSSRIVTTLAITTSGALPNGRTGVAISPVTLVAKGGVSPYSWSLNSGVLPPGVTLDAATGSLSGIPTAPGDYVFTVAVTDATATRVIKQFIAHISDTLAIERTELPDAAVGLPYSYSLQARGGIPASYLWRLKNGTLPSGISLNTATGTLIGTPTRRQNYSFTIEVSDGDFMPQVSEQTFTLDVIDSLGISERSLPNGRRAEAYATTLHAMLGLPPYTWRVAAGSLPTGLTFSPTTTDARITGEPTVPGHVTFSIEVADSATPPQTFTRDFTMEVYSTVAIQTSDLRTVVRGEPYRETIEAIGGARYLFESGIYRPVSSSFSPAVSMNTPRQNYTATRLADGRVLIAGGFNGGYLASAELFDPATGTFSPVGPLGIPRRDHTATLLQNGRVLIAGGFNGDYLASAELYDPMTGAFSPVGPLGTPRRFHTATLLTDGRVLIAGGDFGTAASSCEIYNPATGSFTYTSSLLTARQEHTATILQDGRVFIAGGSGPGGPLAATEIYDPATDSLIPGAAMAQIRRSHSATLLADGRVLIVGGFGASILSTAMLYDPATDSFSPAASLATPRQKHTATLLANGTVLIAGGANSSPLDSAAIYDPAANDWTVAGPIGTAAEYMAAVLLMDGTVFLPGGYFEPYVYSLADGTLPSGIALDSVTGELTGSTDWPAGTSSEVTVHVTDTGNPSQSADRRLLVRVVDPLTITTPAIEAQQSLPYSLPLEAAGGVSPYTAWALVGGALPPGLSLNGATGVIAGTPTACGIFPVTLRVRDAWPIPTQTTKDFDLTVSCASGNFLVEVQKRGTGEGTVTSSPAAISCGSACSAEVVAGRLLTLNALPTAGSRFVGWQGACSGTGPCRLSVHGNTVLAALFAFDGAPTGSIVLNNGRPYATQPGVTATLSATSPLGLAITGAQFSFDGVTWGGWGSFSPTRAVTLPAGDGSKTVSVRFRDTAGHISAPQSATIMLDTTKPVVNYFEIPAVASSATIAVTSLIASDASGIAGYFLSTDSTAPAATASGWMNSTPNYYTFTGITPGSPSARTLNAFVRDAAGNVSLAASASVTITIPLYPVSVTIRGDGTGSVNSSPAGIACTSGTCRGNFGQGTTVILMPTPAGNSIFDGWQDTSACSAAGTCSFAVTGATAVTASFTKKPPTPVWVTGSAADRLFNTITAALAAAKSGEAVEAREADYFENVLCSTTAAVVLRGGYDEDFSLRPGYTVIEGTLTVGRGALTIDKFAIR